jgi:hypothetical protein
MQTSSEAPVATFSKRKRIGRRFTLNRPRRHGLGDREPAGDKPWTDIAKTIQAAKTAEASAVRSSSCRRDRRISARRRSTTDGAFV